jgi:hypothetical protein
MSTVLTCPHCKTRGRLPAGYSKPTVRCPKCRRAFVARPPSHEALPSTSPPSPGGTRPQRSAQMPDREPPIEAMASRFVGTPHSDAASRPQSRSRHAALLAIALTGVLVVVPLGITLVIRSVGKQQVVVAHTPHAPAAPLHAAPAPGSPAGARGGQGATRQVVAAARPKAPPVVPPPAKDKSVSPLMPAAEKPAQATVGLGDDDLTLLKLASVMYYHNNDFVAMDTETSASVMLKTTELLRREAMPPRPTGRSKLASLVLGKWILTEEGLATQDEWNQLISRVPFEWKAAQFNALVDGLDGVLTGKDFPTLAEIRDGPARGLDSLAATGRRNLTRRSLNQILGYQTLRKAVEVINESYGPKLGHKDLTSRSVLMTEPQYVDEVGIFYPAGRGPVYVDPPLIKVSYLGEEPITNVLLIGEVQTTGASATLTDEEFRGISTSLGLNSAFGYGKVNASIVEIVKAEKYLLTMPKTTFCYVPRIVKGDTVRLPLGKVTWEVVTGGHFRAYCDQGYFSRTNVPFTQEAQKASQVGWRRRQAGEGARLRSPF